MPHFDEDVFTCLFVQKAKELKNHLEEILSSKPVEVVNGHFIVEIKPQGVSKGQMVERILVEATTKANPPDLVLCIGDDRSDEDMFTALEQVAFSPHMPAEVGDHAVFAS